MAIISFYADKIAHLAQISLDNPGHRRPNMEQRYGLDLLRDDLGPERRALLAAEFAEDGFTSSVEDADLDFLKVPAGVWLVGDQGIYIMSNVSLEVPGLFDAPFEHAVQSFETDPRGPFDQGDEKDRIFGHDDGSMFLPAELILAECRAVKRGDTPPVVMFDLTPDDLRMVSRIGARSYARGMVISEGSAFFDPDRISPPRLWIPPSSATSVPNDPSV